MGYVLAIAAIAVVGLLLARRRSVPGADNTPTVMDNTPTARPNDATGPGRMTSRRKLREILASEDYETLTDWEKTFCNDVNRQKTGLTWNQANKVDEIWSSINDSPIWDGKYTEECRVAFKLLNEIMESPAFETLPSKDKKYLQRIYSEGEVRGSYRLRRIREVHSSIFKGQT